MDNRITNGLIALGVTLGLAAACGDDGTEATASSDSGATAGTAGTDGSAGTDATVASQGPGGSETMTGDSTSDATTAGTSDPTTEGTTATTTEGVTDTTEVGTDTDPDPCGDCPPNFLCKYDACIPDLGPCATNDDCPGDSYCDADGQCIPYGVPEDVINDPECTKPSLPDGVVPVTQCEWSGPKPGDPTEASTLVYTAPLVADLNLDHDPDKLQPSIILTTWRNGGGLGRLGTLRVFDGRTCDEQMRAGGDDEPNDDNRPGYGTQWVVGDLDGDVGMDGHPEIIGLHRVTNGGNNGPLSMYAFRIDSSGNTPVLERIWYGRDCQTDQVIEFNTSRANYGPSILDLNDDGTPELIMDEMVFDAQGCLLSPFSEIGRAHV